MDIDLPDYQVALLVRMSEADNRDSSALHDFVALMPEASRSDLEVAYEDFQHYGFLHRASGQTFGGPFGRLSTVGRAFVQSLKPMSATVPEPQGSVPPADQYFRFAGGTVIVREEGSEGEPWLLTWLPDDAGDPTYPGFTASPETLEFPTTRGVGGILEWAAKQPWARRAAGEESSTGGPEPRSIEVPADEAATFSQQVHMEYGYRLAVARKPDGSYSWAVLTEDGFKLRSGVADSWDDARLAIIEDLYPPSGEAGGPRTPHEEM